MTENRGGRPSPLRTLAALLLFGLAFGYVEGAVVVTLRAVYDPIHARLRPDRGPDDLFPLITVEELLHEDVAHGWRLRMEVVREGATLVMLAAVPWTFARNFREWIAGFMVGFGVWDLAYYATLKVWLGWPPSLLTWDILFLLPLPWSGPVLAPVLVSASIIVTGVVLLHAEERNRPIPLGPWHWALIVLGGCVVVASFCWEGRSVASGTMPGPFPWGVFATGEGLGLAAFGQACLMSRRGSS